MMTLNISLTSTNRANGRPNYQPVSNGSIELPLSNGPQFRMHKGSSSRWHYRFLSKNLVKRRTSQASHRQRSEQYFRLPALFGEVAGIGSPHHAQERSRVIGLPLMVSIILQALDGYPCKA